MEFVIKNFDGLQVYFFQRLMVVIYGNQGPQGSILDPLLFTIFFNGIADVVNKAEIVNFVIRTA